MALIDKLTAIADAIRAKTGTVEEMTLTEMAEAVAGIQTGGGPLKIHQSLDAPFSSVSFIGTIDFFVRGDRMNILETRSVLVSGIYESDTTFGQLCVDKIIEHLTAYGFTAEPRAHETAILWNGKPRFVLSASSSTTGASVRVAGPWSAASSWGSSYELFRISSTSSDLQTGTITFGFFAIGDVAFFVLSDHNRCASLPCQTIGGTESVVFLRVGSELVVPLFAESIDSTNTGKWNVSVPSMYGVPADPELCAVSRGIPIGQNGIMHGFAESVVTVKTKTPIKTGQVFTINGETYVGLYGELCARVSTA